MKKIIISIIVACNLLTPPELYSYSNMEYVARIDNQKNTYMCVAYAVCNAVESQMRSLGIEVPKGGFSEAWLYAQCKAVDNLKVNEGTNISTALNIARNIGLCPVNSFKTNTEIEDASKYKINSYSHIQNKDIKNEIANGKFVIIKTNVEKCNWLDNDDLILPTKSKSARYHITFLVGFNDAMSKKGYKGFYQGVNSWGTKWGDNGTYNMAYDYTINQAWIFEVKEGEQIE